MKKILSVLDRFLGLPWVKRLCAGILLCMTAVAVYSFTVTPPTGDVRVFMAAANQVQYQASDGLMAVFESWELKGIANRLLMYLVYLPANALVGFENKVTFMIVAKVVYAAGALCMLAVAAWLLPLDKKKKLTAFAVVSTLLFTVHTASQMQAEMSVAVLAVLAIACFLNGKLPAAIAGGLIAATFFYFKSLLILVFPLALLGTALLKATASPLSRVSYGVICAAFFGGLAALTAGVYAVYPQEFADMSMASDFQSTYFSAGANANLVSMIQSFAKGFVDAVPLIPFLLCGAVAGVMVCIRYIRHKHAWQAVALIGMWLLAADMIIVSNCYFVYHYMMLFLPAAASILLLISTARLRTCEIALTAVAALVCTVACWVLRDGLKQVGFINTATVLLVCMHILAIAAVVCCSKSFRIAVNPSIWLTSLICLFFWMNYNSFIAPQCRNLMHLDRMVAEYNKDALPEDYGDEPVLFLDAGVAAYYTDAPSYSRYYFNLPLQRWNAGDEWECKELELDKLMAYDGEYILHTSWFPLNKYPEVQQKLHDEYELYTSIMDYAPSWNVFTLQQVSPENMGYIRVLKKKGS